MPGKSIIGNGRFNHRSQGWNQSAGLSSRREVVYPADYNPCRELDLFLEEVAKKQDGDIKFCPKCVADTERYITGMCKPCQRKRSLRNYHDRKVDAAE